MMENPNSDMQSKPSDSNPSSNTRASEHEEIALLFRMATDKLGQVEANAEKEKQQIVRDLARELERFRPIDRIASEIVEELREKVSKSVIYAALDERYKTSYRVQNARKRKKQKENKTGSLAPTSELKPLVVDTSGYSTQQLVSETYSSDAGDDNKPQDNEPVNINEKQKVGGNTDTNSSPPVTREVTECEHCQLKNSRIKELEDIVRKTTQLTPANQIAEENDNKIMQLRRRELAESRDDVIRPHEEANQSKFEDNNEEGTTNAESKEASPTKQKEDLTDTKRKVLVSSISMPFEALQKDLAAIFRRNNGKVGSIFFKISVDLGKLVGQIECCGITPQKDITMISIGEGILTEAN
jgi:hypothetical protein